MKKDNGKASRFFGRLGRTRQELELSEVKFKELLDSMSSGVAIYRAKDNGRDFIFTDFNRAAERILEKHNGKIWVESKPGEGSKFFVDLPGV